MHSASGGREMVMLYECSPRCLGTLGLMDDAAHATQTELWYSSA